MVQTIQAKDLTLHDVQVKFGLRLALDDMPQYGLSDEFTLRRGNDLYNVLSVLKRLGALLNQD